MSTIAAWVSFYVLLLKKVCEYAYKINGIQQTLNILSATLLKSESSTHLEEEDQRINVFKLQKFTGNYHQACMWAMLHPKYDFVI